MMKREPFHPIINPLSAPSSDADDQPPKRTIAFKALLGVSVTTADFDSFRSEYDSVLGAALKKHGIPRTREIYKAAQLAKMNPEHSLDIMTELAGELNPVIDRIDIYCTHLEFMPSVSIYGGARGSRIHPVEFLNLIENSYPQICGWKYTRVARTTETILQFDHFEGKTSPSWKEMQTKVGIEIYYSGGEVNPLISLADMVLRVVDTYQLGRIDQMSATRPIIDHASAIAPKVRYHEITSIDDLKAITPDIPADMDTSRFVKRPIFYFVWNPREPRKLVKQSFEWSELYTLTMNKAAGAGGCVKNFEISKDEIHWDSDKDFLVPWTQVDIELVEQLSKMYPKMPKSLTLEQLR